MKGKEYSARRNVFSLTGGSDDRVMCFEIFPQEAHSKSESRLRNLIEISGGMIVKYGEQDPYSVKVLDLDWYLDRNLGPPVELPQNTVVFSPTFVEESYLRNKIQDLNNYRLGERMPFDVNLIAQRKLTWSESKRIKNKERDLLNGAGLANQSLQRNLESKDFPHGLKIVCSRPERISSHAAVTTATGTNSDIARGRACSPAPVENEIDLESVSTNVQENVRLDRTANPRGLLRDDECHSSAGNNQATRKKLMRSRREIPALIPLQSEEPASKKKKQDHFLVADMNTEKVHFACFSRAKINSGDNAHLAGGNKIINQERTYGNPSDIGTAAAGSSEKGDDGNLPRNGSVSIKERKDPTMVQSRTNVIPGDPHDDGTNTSIPSSDRKWKMPDESADKDVFMHPSHVCGISKASKRNPYSVEDGKALLKLICDNNLHYYYSGMILWNKAQEEGILDGRSASSMWEHFRKKIIPNLKSYGCSEIDMQKFAEVKKFKEGKIKQTLPKNFYFKTR